MQKKRRVYVVRRNTNNYEYTKHSPSMGYAKEVNDSAKVDSKQAFTSIRVNKKGIVTVDPKYMISELDRRHMVVITPSGEKLHYVRGRQVPRKKSSVRS